MDEEERRGKEWSEGAAKRNDGATKRSEVQRRMFRSSFGVNTCTVWLAGWLGMHCRQTGMLLRDGGLWSANVDAVRRQLAIWNDVAGKLPFWVGVWGWSFGTAVLKLKHGFWKSEDGGQAFEDPERGDVEMDMWVWRAGS